MTFSLLAMSWTMIDPAAATMIISGRFSYVISSSVPTIQLYTFERSSGSATIMKSWVSALNMYISDVPHRIIIVGVALRTLLISRITTIGISAKTNAFTTTPPPAISSTPRMSAMAAPNPAPEEMPIVYGSARGFFSMLCIAVPQTANANPHTMAPRILGILRSMTTHWSLTSLGMLMMKFQMTSYTSDIVIG